ncbi:hypothetical protein QTP70_011035 [Hemibagrus guttatus]|uniref:ribonuclease H n=1 Tax=Hemibagrus guttatus TaxID=175788 RepID=A0AAE0QN42_9TELE|nr:hypothetical protein QTP70_011035 [Hemibagrus guttatus]
MTCGALSQVKIDRMVIETKADFFLAQAVDAMQLVGLVDNMLIRKLGSEHMVSHDITPRAKSSKAHQRQLGGNEVACLCFHGMMSFIAVSIQLTLVSRNYFNEYLPRYLIIHKMFVCRQYKIRTVLDASFHLFALSCCYFKDLEKAYDRVPREELWYCMRKSGVAEKYVRVVQDMYERSRTVVRCAVGQTEEFNVEVGLHQGSALSPFLFAIVMDQLSEEVRQESPWTMMFADDIVICSESREQVEENLERWRFALERRGMKVSRSKTEYMCVNEREGSGRVRLQGEEVKKVQEFKYLGSTVQSNGECGKEVKKRVQAGWNGWRKVSGVLCDQKISARIKGKVYRTVVRPAMLYGLDTVSLRKRQESELEVAELKMLRFSLGVTRLDRIRNEYISGTAHVGRLGDKVREARLRWFGHVQRREKPDPIPGTLCGYQGYTLEKDRSRSPGNMHIYMPIYILDLWLALHSTWPWQKQSSVPIMLSKYSCTQLALHIPMQYDMAEYMPC